MFSSLEADELLLGGFSFYIRQANTISNKYISVLINKKTDGESPFKTNKPNNEERQ